MKLFKAIVWILPFCLLLDPVQAATVRYQVKMVFWDNTEFTGTFDYDIASQQVTNLHGLLDDVAMGNIELIKYQLESKPDGKGGITAYAYAFNSTEIATSPNINNNVYVAINFNAQDPSLGATNPDQLSYMDCSQNALMFDNQGIGNCMYHLPWHDPVFYPMGGERFVLSETITIAPDPLAHSDCLFNWAEINYANIFSPNQSAAGSIALPPYYYRFYSNSNSYLGISSADNHIYYLTADGALNDAGPAYDLLSQAGCSL